MSDLPSFRSSINGFNRTDVIDFLKKILDENSHLKEQLSEAASLNASLQSEIDKCRSEIDAIKSERQTEELLGRTMCDARRFSDTIVQEANDKAARIFENAVTSANEVSVNADNISAQVNRLNDCFTQAIGGMVKSLSALGNQLSAFSESAEQKKQPFTVTPDEVPAAEAPEEASQEKPESPEETEDDVLGFKDDGDDIIVGTETVKPSAPIRISVKKVKRPNDKK